MSSAAAVTIERDRQVAVVTLRRPAKRNALNDVMWDGLQAAVAELRDDLPRAVVLTGEGDAFCAGHDISLNNTLTAAFFEAMQSGEGAPIRALLVRLKGIFSSVEQLPVPTIAAINGDAHGGGVELALCCDLRVLDEQATLCMSETRIGLMPDLGGTARLTRLLGRSRSLDLICTARDLGGDEALELGLVNRLAPAGKALDAALDTAALIAQNGPAAVRGVKAAVQAMGDIGPALEAETAAAVECILAGQGVEGVTAWMQKRPAKWPDE